MSRIPKALLCILAGFAASAQAQESVFRSELKALQELVCAGDTSPSPQDVWKLGLHDAQINAMRSNYAVGEQSLVNQTRIELQKRRHHGYAYGQCPDGNHSWIITTPATGDLIDFASDGLHVNLPLMAKACASVDIDFAAEDGGMPRNLLRRGKAGEIAALINPHFLHPGTLSVTCHPKDKKKSGPELWALAAVRGANGSDGDLPDPSTAFEMKDFYSWLQKRRSDQGLANLKINPPELQALAEELSKENSLKHPRALLNERGRDLKKKKISLLGENRAAAANLSEMAWLLWNSPQHRRLILNPKANSLGLAVKGNGREKLLVMVVGKI